MPRIVVGSEFFNDISDWDLLRGEIPLRFPDFNRGLRAWSAGCNAGHEAYSLAMMLDELAPDSNHYLLATDRDSGYIAKAADGGPYTVREISNLSSSQFNRYMMPKGPPYFVIPALAQRVTFRTHDLLYDVFEQDFELIIFRNVERTLTSSESEVVYGKLLSSLKPDGLLFIGSFDRSPSNVESQFKQINRHIFVKSADLTRR